MSSQPEAVLYHNQSSLLIPAAMLILPELEYPTGGNITMAVNKYTTNAENLGYDHYSIVVDDEVVAASFVHHSFRFDEPNHRYVGTYVDTMAVRHTLQKQGYGRILMRHIANQATALGDEHISLYPYDTTPYERFGFYYSEPYMRATPAAMLASRSLRREVEDAPSVRYA